MNAHFTPTWTIPRRAGASTTPAFSRKARPRQEFNANILAPPLIALAPDIAQALEPGGALVLAGLLTTQAEAVAAAYRRQGLRMEQREERGEWTILVLRRPGFRLRG